jgi:alpha-beta hydrolase superfamily lysophospholipase
MFYKLLKFPFFGRFMTRSWINPLAGEQLREWKPLRIQSKSGGSLAVLHASAARTPARATLVLGHPMGKEAKGYFIKHGYTDFYRHCGYNVVVFDVNGFGESTHGNFSYFEDIHAVGTLAAELYPGMPLGYHGVSLGAQWAMLTFTAKDHNYDFAIIESAATTLQEFWIKFPVAYRVLTLVAWLMPTYNRKIKMIDHAGELKRLHSLLYIYSHADTYTPVEMGERFRDKSNVPAELWVVANAEHARMMRSEHKAAYLEKLVTFIEKTLAEIKTVVAVAP